MDANTFDLKGPWEQDRGPQQLAYDFWWHLGHDTMITSEWGTPNMVKNGVNPELLLAGKYGHKIHVWDLDRRCHLQELDLGAEQQWVLELRPSHDPNKTYGFVSVGISLKDLSSSIWIWYREEGGKNGKWAVRKVIEIPAEPADPENLPPLLKGFKAVPPLITDINLSLDDRFLYVSCWGTGEFIQYDVSDPANPKKTGSVHLGGIVRRAAHPNKPQHALNGGPQMVEISRDGKRVYFTNSLYSPWDAQIYPDGLKSWMVKLDVDPKGGMKLDEKFFVEFDGLASAPGSAGWRGRLILIPTATRTRNDTRRDRLKSVVADAAPRCLPRSQPRDGVALRGGAGDARAEGKCGSKSACPDRSGSCLGHRQCCDGCGGTRHGAATRDDPLHRRRNSVRLGDLLPDTALSPRWVRMQVGFRDLTIWSFLMATAHGAGLMVLPVLLGSSTTEAQGHVAGHNQMSLAANPVAGLLATGIHTIGYLAVTGLLAWAVYRKLGLSLLGKTWFNFNLVWGAALVATSLFTLLM